jgi:integrase
MGTVRKRVRLENGRRVETWIVDYRDAAGVRHRPEAKSKSEAKELLRQMEQEARESTQLRPDNPVLAEYAQRWLELAATRLKAKTVRSYAQLLNAYILPELGNLKLRDVERRHVKQLLATKRAQGLSKNSVRLIRATLSAMFAEALDDGLVKVNPATAIARHRGSSVDGITQTDRQAAIRPFGDEEVAAFLDTAKAVSFDFHVLFLTMFRTGMRPGEVRALRWSDIDLNRREILIERAFSDNALSTTKTGEPRRVDMSQELAAALARLYTVREKQALARGWGEVPELVFLNNAGHALDHARLRKMFERIMRHAGLTGHVPYDTRHTFITSLLSRGTPINYVSAAAGHRDPTTTLRWYSHWLPRQDKSYVDSLDSGSMAPKLAPDWPVEGVEAEKPFDLLGADGQNRTGNPLITSQLLYR